MNPRLKLCLLFLTGITSVSAVAQTGDSVIVNVGKESKVIFLIKNQDDLNTLKQYNLQSVIDDMVQKLEKRDSTSTPVPSTEFLKETPPASTTEPDQWERDRDRDEDRYYRHREKRENRRTYHSINFDIGMNNYLQNGSFPDANSLYTVKPWGSWYVGMNSIMRTRVAGKFFIEWGGGVSWYNFKFDNERVTISKDDTGVIFAEDTRDLDFKKSKLTAAYVNVSMVPMIDFGGYGRKATVFGGHRYNYERHGGFRVGLGPYAGYRLDSYSKQMYIESSKVKEHNHDNFYMANVRYGMRFQVGFRDTDLFVNYDLNELFTEGKGPKLNAFSFGITL